MAGFRQMGSGIGWITVFVRRGRPAHARMTSWKEEIVDDKI